MSTEHEHRAPNTEREHRARTGRNALMTRRGAACVFATWSEALLPSGWVVGRIGARNNSSPDTAPSFDRRLFESTGLRWRTLPGPGQCVVLSSTSFVQSVVADTSVWSKNHGRGFGAWAREIPATLLSVAQPFHRQYRVIGSEAASAKVVVAAVPDVLRRVVEDHVAGSLTVLSVVAFLEAGSMSFLFQSST